MDEAHTLNGLAPAISGIVGIAGSLILGKIKKSVVPFPWGPKNNAIPVTNPVMVGIVAHQMGGGDLATTGAAVAGSLAAWAGHQLFKNVFGIGKKK